MIALAIAAALVLNPAVTQRTIHRTVCLPGWSASVRPPSSVTTRIKRLRLPKGARMADYTLDHWTPIAIGGHPSDPRNLVLQTKAAARAKDRTEAALHHAVCKHRISLRDAQLRITTWHE